MLLIAIPQGLSALYMAETWSAGCCFVWRSEVKMSGGGWFSKSEPKARNGKSGLLDLKQKQNKKPKTPHHEVQNRH